MRHSIRLLLLLGLALTTSPGEAVQGTTSCGTCGGIFTFEPDAGDVPALPVMNLPSVRASLDSLDGQITGTSCKKNNAHPSGSDDGNRVTWVTAAPLVDLAKPNMPPLVPKPKTQVYVRSFSPGMDTVLVSDPVVGGPDPEGYSEVPRMSGDGQWISFTSSSRKLTVEDEAASPNYTDIFTYDVSGTCAGPRVQRVSETPVSRIAGNGSSGGVSSISPDGRFVAFQSTADNLQSYTTPCAVTFALYLAPYGNGKTRRKRIVNIYLRDRGADLCDDSDDCIEWISPGVSQPSMSCAQPDGPSYSPSVSANGCLVVFESDAKNLVDTATMPKSSPRHVFMRDRVQGRTILVSHAMQSALANERCSRARISADGKWIVFESKASNLVPGDTNGTEDIFAYEVGTAAITRLSLASDGSQLPGKSATAEISGNGRFVAYTRADATVSNIYEMYVVDRDPNDDGLYTETPMTKRISDDSGGLDADGWSGGWPFGLATDGQFVFFMTIAADLAAGDTNALCNPCGSNAFTCDEGRDIYRQQLYLPPAGPAPGR